MIFNFIYSNFYLLYFVCICLLAIFNKTANQLLQIYILTFLSFIYYKVRSYLETDAMTRAPYVAKEYIKKCGDISKDELSIIMKNYNEINGVGIKLVNFNLFAKCIIKIIIYSIICLV